MFSTVKSCKLLVFLGLALCLLLPGAPAFADTPMPPSQESSQCALVEPLGYTDDVVDTYWSYSCPRGVSGPASRCSTSLTRRSPTEMAIADPRIIGNPASLQCAPVVFLAQLINGNLSIAPTRCEEGPSILFGPSVPTG